MKIKVGETLQDGKEIYLLDKVGTKYVYWKVYRKRLWGEKSGEIVNQGYFIQTPKKEREYENLESF